eukprot:scaffold70128_cov21-Prasinocladus_malaysianus.AAC.1
MLRNCITRLPHQLKSEHFFELDCRLKVALEVEYPDIISMAPVELKLSAAERKAMRAALSEQICELQLEKENKRIADLNVRS